MQLREGEGKHGHADLHGKLPGSPQHISRCWTKSDCPSWQHLAGDAQLDLCLGI